MARTKNAGFLAYDLRVTLLHLSKETWRLVRVPHDIRMDRLDQVLQAAMGWTNSHMHQFHLFTPEGEITGYVGRPDPDSPAAFLGRQPPTQDETKRLLKNFLAKPGDRIGYEYDFGDSWLHEITLAAVEPLEKRLSRAACLDGARACPPEDCGGPPGYDNLLKIIKKPKHPEYESMIEWVGEGFDPAAFDLASTNEMVGCSKV
ncbi:MAG: plasmid pRiA4b ORF-3 family protein [Verrucomicrobia bacterium]|nr:plasmid pRiA4b ORF-3 family protein [Verrucomicrobiota bacterium]